LQIPAKSCKIRNPRATRKALRDGPSSQTGGSVSLLANFAEHLFPWEQMFHTMVHTDAERSATNISQWEVLALWG
jgi:hypothetical protein